MVTSFFVDHFPIVFLNDQLHRSVRCVFVHFPEREVGGHAVAGGQEEAAQGGWLEPELAEQWTFFVALRAIDCAENRVQVPIDCGRSSARISAVVDCNDNVAKLDVV